MAFDDSRKNWKHISGKQKNGAQVSLSKNKKNKYVPWQPNHYFLFRDAPYCVPEDGHMYMMVAFVDPSIGYKLVSADQDRKLIEENSLSISEREAMDVLFQDDDD